MELLVGIAVLAVFVSVWIGLAVASVQKGHPIFVLGAIMAPVPVAIITLNVLAKMETFKSTGGLEDLGKGITFVFIGVGSGILSSYLVLAVGAILPRAESVDSGGAPLSIERLIGGQTSMDDSVDSSEHWDQESDV